MIRHMYLNRKMKLALNIATPAVGSSAVQKTGRTERGVTIAVLDTGVFPHPDLRGRIVGFKDFIRIVKSRMTTTVTEPMSRDVLPETGDVPLVVLPDREGIGSIDDVIAGVEWAIRNRRRFGIRVINLSLDAKASSSFRRDPLCQAIGRAVRSGLVAVVCAGNMGPARRSIGTPGISPLAITVGAAND